MAREKFPSAKLDQYMIRFPDGMRDRIKKAAERSGRSMNAEIITALEQYFPPEPTVEDVLERVHLAIDQANRGSVPYRSILIRALDELSDRLSSGLEPDQYRQRLPSRGMETWDGEMTRMQRWRRVQETGVEQADLEREISRGMFRRGGGDRVKQAIDAFKKGNPLGALREFRLHEIKFADPEAAYSAIERDLRQYFEENWGNPDEEHDWSD